MRGFNAADPALVSVHWLVDSMRAEEQIEGERAFRMEGGYQTLIEIFREPLNRVSIQLNTVIRTIEWSSGRVHLQGHHGGESYSATAPRVLVTLPLGVLQAAEPDGIRFIPPLPEHKQRALSQLIMGKVTRVSLLFRQRFWEKLRAPGAGHQKTLSSMSFLFSDDNVFPTWWTQMPKRSPVITGWAPADSSERLSGQSESVVVEKSLAILGGLLKVSRQETESLLERAYWHDWQSDPFSRGAYSYVRVGGQGAQHELGAAIGDQLYFAGEATDVSGHNGTVHGAIASGKRAAEELLRGVNATVRK